ncbi:hypothetical protein KC19_9G135400 [Ceratodon purpureus]|uniref:CP-type G domain-containing protein n=1 Tax=Ceratodon purpureus TaxID=3225 RepID=A0A8T0GTR0_CERPU|nr:hypothetical protein KC19_9G135400 [Ceratodon purpureus]
MLEVTTMLSTTGTHCLRACDMNMNVAVNSTSNSLQVVSGSMLMDGFKVGGVFGDKLGLLKDARWPGVSSRTRSCAAVMRGRCSGRVEDEKVGFGGGVGGSRDSSKQVRAALREGGEVEDSGIDDVESKVTGKSRGEIFLERAMLAHESAPSRGAEVVVAKKERKKKREKLASFVARRDEPCCYGCGAVLQSSDVEAPGFLPLATFEVKKKHHQLKTVLCGRCVLLSQGAMIPAVSGNGGYGEGKGFISADELRAQLTHLKYEKALIVKLVDIVDFNGSFLTRVRDLVGSNPIILVVTKIDLLPKGTDMAAVGDWVIRATLAKKLNVISVHLTSAKAVTGISGFSALMQRQRQGRDVYVLGSANVGKSAFISSLLRDLGERDPIAAAAQRFRPIQSAMPGTTLGPIQIDAFSGGGSLYDTPGVHLHHRMAAAVSPEDLPLLAPRKRLTGRLIAAPSSISLVGQSLFWGGIVRIDVLEAPENVALTFFGPNSIPVIGTLTSQADLLYEKELGGKLFPPGGERVKSWPGLANHQDVRFVIDSHKRPAGDLTISGLGWITVGLVYNEEEETGYVNHVVRLRIHTPKAVETFMRPSMPVGSNATEWYEYMEVEDDESEATRPTLVY